MLFAETLPLSFQEMGSGRPFVLLHGGAGPASMAGLAGALAEEGRSILPTHPGFNGEPRPEWFASVGDLALAYLELAERLDLQDAVLVGNSVGGWIAAEMALRASRRLAALVLINPVGLAPSARGGIVDPMVLPPPERSKLSFHDPARFALAPSGPDAASAMAANGETLRVYAGDPFMHDPSLLARLPGMRLPTLVLWGASDRIVTPDYGRQFAEAIPGARFQPVEEAGHFPQIERLQAVSEAILTFAAEVS